MDGRERVHKRKKTHLWSIQGKPTEAIQRKEACERKPKEKTKHIHGDGLAELPGKSKGSANNRGKCDPRK